MTGDGDSDLVYPAGGYGSGGGGSDGGSGGKSDMDQIDGRVGRLERQWDSLQETLTGLKTSLATLDERTKHMPTRFEFYTVIFGTGAFFTTLLTLAIRLDWI